MTFEIAQRLRARFRAWHTRRLLEALPERQRKDIGYPSIGYWAGHDPRPAMRYPSNAPRPAAPVGDPTPVEPRLRRAG